MPVLTVFFPYAIILLISGKVCVRTQKQQLMKAKKLHLIYGWVVTALLIAVGIALIASCLSIYHSGDRPYSPTSIAQQFQKISLLVYISLAAVLGGIVLRLALPAEAARPKATPSPWMQLTRQQAKAGSLTSPFAESAAKEQALRKRIKRIALAAYIILMIYPLRYLLDSSNFTVENLNSDIVKALAMALLPAVLGLCGCFICRHFCDKSLLREVTVWKDAIAAGAYTTQAQGSSKNIKVNTIRTVILVLAAGLIIAGIFNGSAADVLLKAIAICTECIGLG